MVSQIRAPVVEPMGGVPVALRVPEYDQSVPRGAVQGLMTTPGAVFDVSIDALIHQVYEAPLGGGLTVPVMPNEVHDRLPGDLQAVIDGLSGCEQSRGASACLRDDETEKLESLDGVEIRHATEAQIAAGLAICLASAPAKAGCLAAIQAAHRRQRGPASVRPVCPGRTAPEPRLLERGTGQRRRGLTGRCQTFSGK